MVFYPLQSNHVMQPTFERSEPRPYPTMSTNVLVPIDGSDHSYGGLAYALETFPEAELTTIHVVDPRRDHHEPPGPSNSWEEKARAVAQRYHERAKEIAGRYDATVDSETTIGITHKEILEHVVEGDVDHVVMGSHGHSPITHPFVGHVTEAVARRAPVPVSIVPEPMSDVESRDLPGRVLVPIDDSERAKEALDYALSQLPGASVTALHVVTVPGEYEPSTLEGTYVEQQLEELGERADGLLASARERAAEHDREIATATAYGKPARSIVEYAIENEFDQIVIGSHGRSRVYRVLLGSVAETVAQRSPITVTIVRDR